MISPNATGAALAWVELRLGVSKVFGLLHRDSRLYREVIESTLELTRLPLREALLESKRIEDSAQERSRHFGHFLSRQFFPSLHSSFVNAAEASVQLDLIRTALAIERYRATRNGAIPADLSVVVKEQIIPAIPQDPFTRTWIQFHQTAGGYVLSSAGRDGKHESTVDFPAISDLTFTVYRAK